ncbi:MAG: 23S rRNA (uracil(1939)-C(5))-methyltransferase RlmD, partial [Oscillospiraceae bacterium]|nr:23S rRNA (uracil(1939)-C(5))-methyltransferase RlmD [Oscillospiraceae bacterium]
FQEILNNLLPALQKANISAYNELSHTGELRHIYLRKGYHSGEIMLCFITRKSICKKLNLLLDLQNKFPDIVSISESVNSEKTNVIMGKKVKLLAGKNFIIDTMCENQIKISPQSFYQVNTAQAEQLYQIAKHYADLQGNELVLDLYCGAGTIGLSMADSIKKLIGVEVIPEAVENAKENARQNNISNAEFYCGDAGMISKKLLEQKLSPDIVILDPPRKGCDSMTIQSVINMQPDKIIMISCNPATCARDSAIFAENHYLIEKVKAVDLFPSTAHVECIVLMSRK